LPHTARAAPDNDGYGARREHVRGAFDCGHSGRMRYWKCGQAEETGGTTKMPGPVGAWIRRIAGTTVRRPVTGRAGKLRQRNCRRRGSNAGQKRLQHDQPRGKHGEETERVRSKPRCHENLSRGTLSHPI
jgi:hypothetical protein